MQRKWRSSRLAPLAVLVLAVALYAAPAAGAVETVKWTIQSTPTARLSTLSGVSCPTTSFCVAVGVSSTSPERGLIEKWNGSEWTEETTVEGRHLFSVSCVSATWCVASGDYKSPSGVWNAFTDTWNGTSWKAFESGWPGQLYGIACTSTSDCTAVGQDEENQVLVEIWNGSGWEHEHGASSSEANGKLYGVSCSAERYCTAVGSVYNYSLSEYQTLVERRIGKYWTTGSGAETSGVQNELYGVSCFTESFCKAVGVTGGNPLIDSGGEGSLSFKDTNPSGMSGDELRAVSCATSSECLATGAFQTGKATPVATSWNGSKWTLLSPATPEGVAGSYLEGVSCRKTGSGAVCTAVGFKLMKSGLWEPLVERYEREE